MESTIHFRPSPLQRRCHFLITMAHFYRKNKRMLSNSSNSPSKENHRYNDGRISARKSRHGCLEFSVKASSNWYFLYAPCCFLETFRLQLVCNCFCSYCCWYKLILLFSWSSHLPGKNYNVGTWKLEHDSKL